MIKSSRTGNRASRGYGAVPIPLVDRGRGDSRNIGGMLHRDENSMYTIAVTSEILNGKFSRNQFHLCQHALMKESDVNHTKTAFTKPSPRTQLLEGKDMSAPTVMDLRDARQIVASVSKTKPNVQAAVKIPLIAKTNEVVKSVQ